MSARRRVAPLLAVEAATVLSGVANGITLVVLPWLVLQRTGNAAAAGLVAAVTALPLLFASFLSGTVVDRVGRRRTSVVSDVLSGLSVAALPVADLLWGLDLTWIAALAALGAVFDPAGVTARESMLPEAARAARMPLERVNGIHEAAWGSAFVVGPGIAGVAIAGIGAASTLWATTAAFALSALVVAAVPIPGGGRPPARPHAERTTFWHDTTVGLRFVVRDRVLLSVGLFSTLLMATYLPIEAVLLPVFFTGQAAPGRLGILLMTMSVGWVLGSLVYGAVGPRLPRRATFVCASIGTATALVPLAFLPPFPVMLVAGALSGFLYGPVNPVLNLAMQLHTPEHLRGRVVGVITSIGYAAGPVGYLLAGGLVEWIGLQPAFFVMTAGVLMAALSTAFLQPLQALDDAPSRQQEHRAGGPSAFQHPVGSGRVL